MSSMEIWGSSLANRTKGTRKQYLHYFNGFINFVKKSPDELREMKYKENMEAKPWERNRVENMLREYLKTLEEKNMTCSTQNLALASIRSFFDAQGMPLFMKREDKPVGCAFGSKALTTEEIRQTKNAAEHLRDKALILFLKDSGLRESDAAKLKWKDFKDYGEGFWGFQIQTKKKGIKARGFIGSDATELLNVYKRKRLEGTQKLPPEKNIDENPVFALLGDPAKAVSSSRMSGTIGTIINLAQIENASAHGLRKFWEQNIHVEHPAYQKQMNGRALDSVERAYYWLETEKLLELYRRNYHNLRIEQSDFKEVEDRIRRDYEREIEKLQSQLDEEKKGNLNTKGELKLLKDILDPLKPMLEFASSFENAEDMLQFLNAIKERSPLARERAEEVSIFPKDTRERLREQISNILDEEIIRLTKDKELDKDEILQKALREAELFIEKEYGEKIRLSKK